MRYERKYRIETSNYERVYHELLSNPACFHVAFPERVVNSIYYDDINYTAYNDNLLGVGERIKYRVRWYGEEMNQVTRPILEKKIKKSLLGTKEYLKLDDFSLTTGAPELPIEVAALTNQLYPHIIVRYRRTYLESMDGKIRATIDRGLMYHDLFQGKVSERAHRDDAIILEIKYDQDSTNVAAECMGMIPYRLTKNSKYVSAMRLYLQ